MTETQIEQEQKPVEPVTFFSSSSCLALNVSIGKVVPMDGEFKRIGQKVAEFTPIGAADSFGRLTTSDPEIIAFLRKRMNTLGDVFDAQEYGRRTTPVEQRLAMSETEKDRVVTENNRLIELLKQNGIDSTTGKKKN